MFQLPPALHALSAHRQFIVYQVVPSVQRPGKTDKFPIDWRTGRIANAHDPAIWLDCPTAASYAELFGPDYGVGFVFTPGCGLWFLDVDDCLLPDSSGWSPIALELLSRFQGAAWEVSVSGRGLHGIGSGHAPTPRRVSPRTARLFDLYTEGRFVALTGTSILGDAGTDHTPALAALVTQYLTPDTGPDADWTSAPCPEWRGPEDDARLIERALRSSSAGAAFGTRASFADLYEANEDVLARMYPPDHKDTGPYDQSKADSALAQHLAFWTGRDCERIACIMGTSKLVREKWNRDDYLRRTVLGVVSRQRDVLQDKPAEPVGGVAVASGGAQGRLVSGDTFLNAQEQLTLFQGCVYVCGLHRVLVPGGYLLKPDQFRVMYGGYSFPMDPQNERVSRNAWEAFTESQLLRYPRADGVCFRPDRPPGELAVEAGATLANVWWPIETPCAEGDVGPFVHHLERLLPDAGDRAKLLGYMAAIVQYPGRKFQWAPLLQGVKGNGKTLLVSCLANAVGDRYTHLPNAKDFGEGGLKFTGWLQSKLLVAIEEIHVKDRRDILDALNPLITNARVEIQAKGQDQYTGDNRANFFACSNHKDAVPTNNEERRWAIFYTAQQTREDLTRDGMADGYFPALYDWLNGRAAYAGQTPGYAIVTWYLRNYTIPDALNPAVGSHRAPLTTSTSEAMELSVGAIEQEIKEMIEQDAVGFAGGWVSSIMLDRLLDRLKAGRRVPPGKRREMLQSLGYDWHPALPEGRVNNSVTPDGGKPKLFIKRGHLLGNLDTPAAVARRYSEDQNRVLTVPSIAGRQTT